jgi:hypothetical protein
MPQAHSGKSLCGDKTSIEQTGPRRNEEVQNRLSGPTYFSYGKRQVVVGFHLSKENFQWLKAKFAET